MTLGGLSSTPHPVWDARRLWSLADMINFGLGSFVHGRQFLWQELVFAHSQATQHQNQLVPEELAKRFHENIMEGMRLCIDRLEMDSLSKVRVDMENLIANYEFQPYNWARFYTLLQRLWDDLDWELGKEWFYHYSHEGARLVAGAEAEWKTVIEAFPSSKAEVIASMDCYAQGYNVACVFHMMRVAELGLRAIAKERGIKTVGNNKPIEWGTWRDVFQSIEPQLKILRGKPAGPKRDAALAFYETALSDLHTLQGLYRDPTMHFREKYDPGEAYTAMFRVKSLMKTLSTKLHENRSRKIAWGV